MPNIDQDLQRIMEARYGRDVRKSIHDAIYDINVVADEAHTVAVDSQESAYNSAQAAAGSASDANISATAADNKAVLSESWAHGGTGTREGEDTNNAEYWARQAQGAVVGVASFNGRSGAVLPAQDDYTINQIKAIGTQGQVPTLNAQGKLEMQTPSGGSGGHTIINSSGDEMTQRSKLKFANATVTDDGVDDATIITTMSGGMVAKFDITSDAGSTVTVTTPSGDVITAEQKTGTTTEWEANTTEYGTHTLTSTLNGQTSTTTVMVDACKVYMVAVAQFNATITVTYTTGATCTCVGGGESYTATTNPQVFTVHSANTYTITVTDGTTTKTESVIITTDGQSESVTITLAPDGSTVLPTDDIQTWLACASIWDKSYTTLSEVLADTTTLSVLIADNNAVDYMVRSTTWATSICADQTAMSYIGLNNYCANTLLADDTWLNAICNSTYFESVLNVKVPTMTSYNTPSGVVTESSYNTTNTKWQGFHAFDDGGWGWMAAANQNNNHLTYQFPSTVKIKKIHAYTYTGNLTGESHNNKIQVSNDGSTWTDLVTGFSLFSDVADKATDTNLVVNNNTPYTHYRLFVGEKMYVPNGTQRYVKLQYYGREDV